MTNDEIRHELGILWRDVGGPDWLRLRDHREQTNSLTPSQTYFPDLKERFGEWPSYHVINMILGDSEEWIYVEALGLVVVDPFRVDG